MRRLGLVALVGVLLAGCAPYQAYSPIAGRPDFCEFVRARVRDNSIPRDIAETYYPECGPYDEARP